MIFVVRYLLNEKENFFSKFLYPTNTNLVGFQDADGNVYAGDNVNPLNLNGTASNFQYTKLSLMSSVKMIFAVVLHFFDVYKIEGGDAAILLTKFMGEMDNDTRRFN